MAKYELLNVELPLTIKTCPSCFVVYAAPAELFKRKGDEGGNWYCPNGHSLSFIRSKVAELEEKLKKSKESTEYWQRRKNEVDRDNQQLQRQISAKKGEITKIKNRVANGVCPCCKRHFTNLERHIKNQHPDFIGKENE